MLDSQVVYGGGFISRYSWVRIPFEQLSKENVVKNFEIVFYGVNQYDERFEIGRLKTEHYPDFDDEDGWYCVRENGRPLFAVPVASVTDYAIEPL